MIKVLVVDDSALMRRQLSQLFQAEGDFTVLQARNGREALEANREFRPDVITLDINMPEMDGITALSLLMAERPVPVVMVSSLTEKGALATFEALNLGAVDYITTPASRAGLPASRGSPNGCGRTARPRLPAPWPSAAGQGGRDSSSSASPREVPGPSRTSCPFCRRIPPGPSSSPSTCRRPSPAPSPNAWTRFAP